MDANQQSLAYVYSRETKADAHTAKVLTEDKARRIAAKIAKLPALLGAAGNWRIFQKAAVNRLRRPIHWNQGPSKNLWGQWRFHIMPDYSDQIPPRDNKTLAIALAAASAVILVLVIGVLFNTHNAEHSVNQPSTQSSTEQPTKNKGG
jgi:hypothetical protein